MRRWLHNRHTRKMSKDSYARNVDAPVWLLGACYFDADTDGALQDDIRSRIWCTYRSNIKQCLVTSDQGWGCMHRTGQMMMAEVLSRIQLGRLFRYSPSAASRQQFARVVSHFIDIPDESASLSLHRILHVSKEMGRPLTEWLGPNSISHCLARLVARTPALSSTLTVHVAEGGGLYKNELDACKKRDTPLLVLCPLKLGLEKIDPVFFHQLAMLFRLPYSVGIMGGKPRTSGYYIGCRGDSLLYLDPHTTQPAVDGSFSADFNEADEKDENAAGGNHAKSNADDWTSTYRLRGSTVSMMPMAQLDPSLCVGFLCLTDADVEGLYDALEAINEGHGARAMFHVAAENPVSSVMDSRDKPRSTDASGKQSTKNGVECDDDDDDEDYELL